MNQLLSTVWALRDAGILAFPASATAKHPDRGILFLGPDGKNKPRWKGEYYPPDGWPTADQHEEMFSGRDVVRMFVVSGTRSGNLFAFDFDHAGLFEKWVAIVPSTIVSKCHIDRSQRSEGFHVAARAEEPISSSVPARTPERKVAIEVRGEGNGFMAAPSVGYEAVQGDLTDLPILTLAEYGVLLDAAATLNEFVPPPPPPPKPIKTVPLTNPLHVTRPARVGDRPGDIYNRTHGQADVIALLEEYGWQIVGYGGDVTYVLRPGETDSTHSGSVNANGVLIVFSTSTQFAATSQGDPRPYAPFDVFTMLKYGGDYPAAARALHAETRQALRPSCSVHPLSSLLPRIVADCRPAVLVPRLSTPDQRSVLIPRIVALATKE